MATKDYVKRGRAQKAQKKPARNNRTTPSGNRTAPSGSRFPLLWAVIAAVLVGMMSYGLYFLSATPTPTPKPATTQQAEPKPTPQPIPTPAKNEPTKREAQPETKPLPPKPAEKWSYIEELENKEIKVEAKKEQAPTRPYLMQCGAYRSETQADERKAMIAFQGLTSQIKVSQGEKGNWYRVVLGPYPQKRKAESDRNKLRRAGIEPCAIWFWE